MTSRPKYKFGDSEANFRPPNEFMYGEFSIGENFYVSIKKENPLCPPELSSQIILQTKIIKKFSNLKEDEFLFRSMMPFYGMKPNYETSFVNEQFFITSVSSYIKSVNAE